MIEARLEKRKRTLLGPPIGKTMIYFVDDVNMPKLDTYGSQPPIELLRYCNGCQLKWLSPVINISLSLDKCWTLGELLIVKRCTGKIWKMLCLAALVLHLAVVEILLQPGLLNVHLFHFVSFYFVYIRLFHSTIF